MDLWSKLTSSIQGLLDDIQPLSPNRRASNGKPKSDMDLSEESQGWYLMDNEKEVSNRVFEFPGPNETYDQTFVGDDPSNEEHNIITYSDYLQEVRVDLVKASEKGWNDGIPGLHRPTFWKMFLKFYTPWPHSHHRLAVQKHGIYSKNYLPEFNPKKKEDLEAIHRDLKRISYYFIYFQDKKIQEILERVLYIVFKRSLLDFYPSGLAQLAILPMYILFTQYTNDPYLIHPITSFDESIWTIIEQELYWMVYCLFNRSSKELFENVNSFSKIVEGIIQKSDSELHSHIQSFGIEYSSLLHSWHYNFLLPVFRKLPLLAPLWDRYMIASTRFWDYHACTCAVLMVRYSSDLKALTHPEALSDFFEHLSITKWHQEEMTNFIKEVNTEAEKLGILGDTLKEWKTHLRIKS